DRQARVRPLALGGFLVPDRPRGHVQARGLCQRPATPGPVRASGRGAGCDPADVLREPAPWPGPPPQAAVRVGPPRDAAGRARGWRPGPACTRLRLTLILIYGAMTPVPVRLPARVR